MLSAGIYKTFAMNPMSTMLKDINRIVASHKSAFFYFILKLVAAESNKV